MHQPVEEEHTDRTLILKLSNGETVIGTVSKETQGYVELTYPFRLMSMINQSGNMNLSIMKWDMTIDFDFPVRVFKSTIVACGKPNDKIVEYYREVVENGFDASEEEETAESNLEEIEEKIKEIMKSSKGNLH